MSMSSPMLVPTLNPKSNLMSMHLNKSNLPNPVQILLFDPESQFIRLTLLPLPLFLLPVVVLLSLLILQLLPLPVNIEFQLLHRFPLSARHEHDHEMEVGK